MGQYNSVDMVEMILIWKYNYVCTYIVYCLAESMRLDSAIYS